MQVLISVFDKRGCAEFAAALQRQDECCVIISTGGTAKALGDAGVKVTQVSDVTRFPELLGGRVKTLHPHIHAGLLAKRSSAEHMHELQQHGINPISVVVCNLYPFEQTVSKANVALDEALENIDIGGVTLLRAAAKNFADVIVLCDPDDYRWVAECLCSSGGTLAVGVEERRRLAVKAFRHTCAYDAAVSSYLSSLAVPQQTLKYGVNPHQQPAAVYSISTNTGAATFGGLPFRVLNGTPGYINLMDALNAWQLVHELQQATGLSAAASFKHVSPAGAAVCVPLSSEERRVYDVTVDDAQLTPQAVAYLRARQADPMCSYGDFAALSDVVDEATASILKTEVSDGIIAPGFDARALEILSAKKNGAYIVIQVQSDAAYRAPSMEYRELYGVVLAQRRNDVLIGRNHLSQSNSVGYAYRGQMIGVGAGQQSRVDCAKLAGRKAKLWYLRFHPALQGLRFKPGTKKVERTNARVHYVEGDITHDLHLFESPPAPLTQEQQQQWQLPREVALGSDAFFPFRDSIDVAAKLGVRYVAQPGGSVQDEGVIQACDEHGITMVVTGVRLFHH